MPAKRCRYKGITYDSKAEAGYHVELKAKKKRGEIGDIELQPTWDLFGVEFADSLDPTKIARAVRVGKYTADFRYFDKRQEEWVVVDIKGQVPKTVTRRDGSKRRVAGGKGWTAFRLRCELLKANYGIDVQVIEGAPYTRMASDLGIK
mgnify:FL=1